MTSALENLHFVNVARFWIDLKQESTFAIPPVAPEFRRVFRVDKLDHARRSSAKHFDLAAGQPARHDEQRDQAKFQSTVHRTYTIRFKTEFGLADSGIFHRARPVRSTSW